MSRLVSHARGQAQAATIGPDLLDGMVRANVLSFQHGLTLARENPHSDERAISLALLSQHSAAPETLATEAVYALTLTGRDQRVATHNRLMDILPLSTPMPEEQFYQSFLHEEGPLLPKLFARRFVRLKSDEIPVLAAIFKLPDKKAARQLLAFVGLTPRRRSPLLDSGRRLIPRLGFGSKRLGPARELAQLDDLDFDKEGGEEIAGALIGLIEAKIPAFPDLEDRALKAVLRLRSRENRFMFLARLAQEVTNPIPVINATRSLLEEDETPTYAAAVAAGALCSVQRGETQLDFASDAMCIAAAYVHSNADRFRLRHLGEQHHHRTVLLARTLTLDLCESDLVVRLCVAHCDYQEIDDHGRYHPTLSNWLLDQLAEYYGGPPNDQNHLIAPNKNLSAMERGRNLAHIASCLPLRMQVEILNNEYQKVTRHLNDHDVLSALVVAIAACLPRKTGLELLKEHVQAGGQGGDVVRAVTTLAPDADGLAVLNDLHPSAITLKLLVALPLADLLQLRDRLEASTWKERDDLLVNTAIAAYASHGKDLFAQEIARLHGAEIYARNVELVVRLAKTAPSGYYQALNSMVESLQVPPAWESGDHSEVIANRARAWSVLGCRDDATDQPEMLRRALREAERSYDHVRIQVLQECAPKLTLQLSGEVDRVIRAISKKHWKLKGLSVMLSSARPVAQRYAARVLRRVVIDSFNRGAEYEWERERALDLLAPHLQLREVRFFLWLRRNCLRKNLSLFHRMAELGRWDEAYKRARARLLDKGDALFMILPFVPKGDLEGVVAEAISALDFERTNLVLFFNRWGILREYMGQAAWQASVVNRLSKLLESSEPSNIFLSRERDITSYLVEWLASTRGDASLLRFLPPESVWEVVTEHSLEYGSRRTLIRAVAVVVGVLSAHARHCDLIMIERAVRDVARWWPPDESKLGKKSLK